MRLRASVGECGAAAGRHRRMATASRCCRPSPSSRLRADRIFVGRHQHRRRRPGRSIRAWRSRQGGLCLSRRALAVVGGRTAARLQARDVRRKPDTRRRRRNGHRDRRPVSHGARPSWKSASRVRRVSSSACTRRGPMCRRLMTLSGRCGWYFRVIREGCAPSRSARSCSSTPAKAPSVREAFFALHRPGAPGILRTAADHPALSEAWQHGVGEAPPIGSRADSVPCIMLQISNCHHKSFFRCPFSENTCKVWPDCIGL